MRLKLITVPDKRLRQPSTAIERIIPTDIEFFGNLAETLLKTSNPPGVGLSAVQVGALKRVFVTYLPPLYDYGQTTKHAPASEIKFFINPEIVDHSTKTTLGDDPQNPALEGCLSIPSLYGPVLRYQTIKVQYQTFVGPLNSQNMVSKTDVFSNFYARVIQHEYDHLEGKLFTDHVKTDSRGLYFDQGNQLVEIANPLELIRW